MLPAAERLAAAPALPPTTGPLALAEAVVRLLDAIEPQPVIVLDDLQRADPDTLALLVHVARFARRPLLVVLHRGVELDGAWPTVGALAEIRRVRDCVYMPLRGLPLSEAEVLVERAAGHRVAPNVLAEIHEISRGNPFFLQELGAQEDGPDAPGWRPPPEVRRFVGVWLSGLAPDTRTLLAHAAVFRGRVRFRRDRGPDPARRGAPAGRARRGARHGAAALGGRRALRLQPATRASRPLRPAGAQPPRARAPPARRAARAQRGRGGGRAPVSRFGRTARRGQGCAVRARGGAARGPGGCRAAADARARPRCRGPPAHAGGERAGAGLRRERSSHGRGPDAHGSGRGDAAPRRARRRDRHGGLPRALARARRARQPGQPRAVAGASAGRARTGARARLGAPEAARAAGRDRARRPDPGHALRRARPGCGADGVRRGRGGRRGHGRRRMGAVAARAPPGLRAARPGVERPRRAGARARHDRHGARGRPVGGQLRRRRSRCATRSKGWRSRPGRHGRS